MIRVIHSGHWLCRRALEMIECSTLLNASLRSRYRTPFLECKDSATKSVFSMTPFLEKTACCPWEMPLFLSNHEDSRLQIIDVRSFYVTFYSAIGRKNFQELVHSLLEFVGLFKQK